MRSRLRPFYAAIVLVACSSSGTTPGNGTSDGGVTDTGAAMVSNPVPPNLRDVERTGEGAVNSVLAAEMDAMQWARAESVRGVMTRVWTAYRPAGVTDGAPAARLSAIDQAITDLGTAIVAHNLEAAANAANAVGLAVPEIFAVYHPDVPTEVLRLDATFRQVWIDAKFGHWDRATATLASMQTDWRAARDRTAARAPRCTRVGGTATVVGDIDATLARLATAVPGHDSATTKMQSDEGALEIDTLELLFDCPLVTMPPTTGLGAACATDAACGSGNACDPRDHRCHPQESAAHVGTPCATTNDCGSDPRAACNQAAADGYPGGYCGMEPCNDIQTCPIGSSCVALAGETPACFKSCTTNSDCRGPDYVCQTFAASSFGPGNHACAFPCHTNADCGAALTCNIGTGICTP